MPVYQCYSPAGLLTGPEKARIAQGITTVHTKVTGVPELYGNVLFHEVAEVDCLVAGCGRISPGSLRPSFSSR